MTIKTKSEFYYGHEITLVNNSIPFTEGSGEIVATVNIGTYSLSDFIIEIARSMNAVGGQLYTVVIDRDTRIITISAPGTFELLFGTGSTSSISPALLMGYTETDTGSATSHDGSNVSGRRYRPQFLLQSFVDFIDNVQSSQATVNVSASGVTEVVTFGRNQIMECNIMYITDLISGGCLAEHIEGNATGISDYRDFISFIIGKGNIEFIADRDDPSTFVKCFLESTRESKDGTSFKIKEMRKQNLSDFFESGLIKFRQTIAN